MTVDINENMLSVAKKFFGFNPNDGVIECVCGDAYDYVKNAKDEQFDFVFMDVNYEEG